MMKVIHGNIGYGRESTNAYYVGWNKEDLYKERVISYEVEKALALAESWNMACLESSVDVFYFLWD
jgi:hypothetical protein